MQNLLRKNFNQQSDSASNGKQAFSKVKRNLTKQCCGVVYNLILMDLRMPNMDGAEAARTILKYHKDLKSIKTFADNLQPLSIFAVTSYADMSSVKVATEAGILKVLVKPVNQAQIEEALHCAQII